MEKKILLAVPQPLKLAVYRNSKRILIMRNHSSSAIQVLHSHDNSIIVTYYDSNENSNFDNEIELSEVENFIIDAELISEETIESLFDVIEYFSNTISADKVLFTIKALSKKYSIEYVVASLPSFNEYEVTQLINMENPLSYFEFLISNDSNDDWLDEEDKEEEDDDDDDWNDDEDNFDDGLDHFDDYFI